MITMRGVDGESLVRNDGNQSENQPEATHPAFICLWRSKRTENDSMSQNPAAGMRSWALNPKSQEGWRNAVSVTVNVALLMFFSPRLVFNTHLHAPEPQTDKKVFTL